MRNKALILAGGLGIRMGKLSQNLPKCLLTVGKKTIIHSLIDSLIAVGINNIIISTRKKYVVILKNTFAEYKKRNCNIRIIENSAHRKSAVRALMNVPNLIKIKEPLLLLLSDIFYFRNPFINLGFNSETDILYGARPGYLLNKANEGIIKKNSNGKVIQIVKYDKATPDDFRWSGMAVCGNLFWKDLSNFVTNKGKSTHLNLEDVFQNRVNDGRRVCVTESPNFININRPRDLVVAKLLNSLPKPKSKYAEINNY